MNLVRQEHPNGCVIASLAMISGKTYREIADELASKCNCEDGVSLHGTAMDWLVEHGYATQTKYAHQYNRPREQWPVEPWAEAHIVCIAQKSGEYHAIVLLRDGTVLDPLFECVKSLSAYPPADIMNIMAVWKVQ